MLIIAIANSVQSTNWYAYCNFLQGESFIEILSCDKCFENALNSINYCTSFEGLFNEKNVSLMRNLTENWFHSDLLDLIEHKQIQSNIFDSKMFDEIATNLVTIELMNMDIETIAANAFKRFVALKILNLSRNKLKQIELTTFSHVPSNVRGAASFNFSNLIEIDLSFNELTQIKMENLAYLEHLRVFNVSNNRLDRFDLRFFTIIAPRLQRLDLSSNHLKEFKLFNNYLLVKSIQQLTVTNSYSLMKNLIAPNLIYLNLDHNYLHDFVDLFSINTNLLGDEQFCILNQIKNENMRLNLSVRHNAWTCDCDMFEMILAIAFMLNENDSNNEPIYYLASKYTQSCYLNKLIHLNSYLFKNFIANVGDLSDMQCVNKNASRNWLTFLTKSCGRDSFLESLPGTTLKTNSTSTTKQAVLKYDMSSSFYWVCSICIAIITLSCLFIAWFYCWKRYALSKRLLLLQRRNIGNPRRSNHNQRTRHVYPAIAALNLNSDNLEINSEGSVTQQNENSSTSVYNNSTNWRTYPNSAYNNRSSQLSNPNGLYYISLNRNAGLHLFLNRIYLFMLQII